MFRKSIRTSASRAQFAAPVALAMLLLSSFHASAGSPRVTNVYPSGGQRGTEIEVECKGSNLEDAKGLLFDLPGFEATPVAAEKGKFKVKIKVAADVRLGEHSFRVVTASGLADLRLFYITPFPMVEEQTEDKVDPYKVQPIALGTTVYGRTPGEDQDRFEVEGKKGQRITASVIAARLQTQQIYDTAISISKSDGTVLAEADDCAFSRQDPVASILAPEDGKYIVTIKDSTNSGIGESHYLLNIGSFAQPQAVYPPGGPAGEEVKFTLLGDPSGPIERKVKLPSAPDERFEVFAEGEQPAPAPNYVRVANALNTLEVEPNDEVKTATPPQSSAPFAFNGVIQQKGDIDYFKFAATKGQVFDVDVFARRLRSPLDSVLAIYDAKGNRIQLNDDDGQPDSHLRWTAPADSDYYVSVKDQLDRGGPLFTYRVEINPVVPKLAVWFPEMVINSSQERRAAVVPKGNRYASLVRLKRMDIGGEVKLVPQDLPPGVNVDGTVIDKTVDSVPVVFEATPDAQSSAKAFKLKAELAEPPKEGSPVESLVQNDVDVAENGNQKSFYSVREESLPIVVADEVPVKINLVAPKVPILQNGSMNLKVVAERKKDFKGQINLALLYSPPGIGFGGTALIKEGENEGIVTISATDKAALQKWRICVVGSADFGKGPVWISTQLIELEVAQPFVVGQIQRTFVDQGDTTAMTVKIDQKVPFEGKAKITLAGLPPGATCDEQEITKEDKEVKLNVKSSANTPAGQHRQLFAQFKLIKDGEEMISNFAQGGVLRVDKASVAKADDKK